MSKTTYTGTSPFDHDLIELANVHTARIIKVIGVGGGGGNAVCQMYLDNIPEVRYLVTNTDAKALKGSIVPDQLQLGPGLGAGGDPEVGRQYAEEDLACIDKVLDDETQMVFITAGMGGGTGTGASPVIAREARRKGKLTVGIVTLPFLFERERQIDKALDGLEALSKEVDAMLVINNQRLYEIYSDISLINAFKRADRTLSNAVAAIVEIVRMHGHVDLDFNDVKTVLTNGGVAVMSSGEAVGEGRVRRAIHEAIHSPLLNNNNVYAADRLLMSITTGADEANALRVSELGEVNDFMAHFSPDITTKWGFTFDPAMGERVKVTILASGFGLYAGQERKRARPADDEPEDYDAVRARHLRRGAFYDNMGEEKAARRHTNVYLFGDEDLRNETLIAEIENVPTRHRTHRQLSQLRQLGTQSPT